jgi:hypothetical protein
MAAMAVKRKHHPKSLRYKLVSASYSQSKSGDADSGQAHYVARGDRDKDKVASIAPLFFATHPLNNEGYKERK